jgi:hypothetical protein
MGERAHLGGEREPAALIWPIALRRISTRSLTFSAPLTDVPLARNKIAVLLGDAEQGLQSTSNAAVDRPV